MNLVKPAVNFALKQYWVVAGTHLVTDAVLVKIVNGVSVVGIGDTVGS